MPPLLSAALANAARALWRAAAIAARVLWRAAAVECLCERRSRRICPLPSYLEIESCFTSTRVPITTQYLCERRSRRICPLQRPSKASKLSTSATSKASKLRTSASAAFVHSGVLSLVPVSLSGVSVFAPFALVKQVN